MTKLTPTLLLPYEAVELWYAYSKELGPEKLQAAYGSHWPRPPIADEQVFEFRVPTCGGTGELVGWASLLYDPTEQVTWHSHGIFPEFQRQKMTKPLTDLSKSLGFSETPCLALGAKILDTNATYQAWMRENHTTRGWKPAGRVTLPIGYDVYVIMREDWK